MTTYVDLICTHNSASLGLFPSAPARVHSNIDIDIDIDICHYAMCVFDLPLMNALDWAEKFGNFVTIDICPLSTWPVKFSIPNHVYS